MRLLLPAAYRRELGTEQLAAFADQYHVVRGNPRVGTVATFWFRELRGLIATAAREYHDLAVGRRGRKPAGSPHHNRKPEMLNTLRKDLLYAFRMIAKTPVVAAIAVISVALGVAANVTVFSTANSWLLRPLPYPDAGRLMRVYENNRNDPDDTNPVAPANFFDWQEQSSAFDAWIATDFDIMSLTGLDRPEQLTVAHVTPNFFSLLGSNPIVGRTFLPDEGGAEDAPVTVLSERLWRAQFGADPAVVGRTITLDGTAHTVVGVIPETFDFIIGTVSLWIASDLADRREVRDTRGLNVTARLRPEMSLTQAQSEMTAIAARLEEQYPAANEDWSVNVQTVREQFPGRTDTQLVFILQAVVVLALLIACANVASLLLAKTDARQKELAVRTALGAGKGRIIQQLLTESVLLALLAGSLGMVLSIWGVGWLATAMPEISPRFFQPRIDGTVVGFGVIVSVLSGLTFGIAPAWQAVSGDLRSALVGGARGGTATRRKRRIRNAFVMAEFAMALTILVGAAMLTELFGRALDIDPGYDPSGLLTMELTIPEHRYQSDADIVRFVDDMRRELASVPGEGVAFMNDMPRTRNLPGSTFTIDGQPVERNEELRTRWLAVTADYLETLEIPLRSGRTFTEADRADAPLVVMVNQRLMNQYFEGEIPLGRRITIQGESREIVGVVNNIAQTRLAGLQPMQPTVYFPMAQRPVRRMRLAIRTEGDPYEVAGPAQQAIWALDPEQPITAIQTLEEFIEVQLAGPDMLTQLLFLIGMLALALAAIGIYGVMAYVVAQQTNELGIRMALGATPRRVLARVTRQGASLAGLGLLFGVPGAVLVGAAILNMPSDIPGLGSLDMSMTVMPMAVVSGILLSVGLVACYLPARRATKIDPVVALREE